MCEYRVPLFVVYIMLQRCKNGLQGDLMCPENLSCLLLDHTCHARICKYLEINSHSSIVKLVYIFSHILQISQWRNQQIKCLSQDPWVVKPRIKSSPLLVPVDHTPSRSRDILNMYKFIALNWDNTSFNKCKQTQQYQPEFFTKLQHLTELGEYYTGLYLQVLC